MIVSPLHENAVIQYWVTYNHWIISELAKRDLLLNPPIKQYLKNIRTLTTSWKINSWGEFLWNELFFLRKRDEALPVTAAAAVVVIIIIIINMNNNNNTRHNSPSRCKRCLSFRIHVRGMFSKSQASFLCHWERVACYIGFLIQYVSNPSKLAKSEVYY